MDTRVAGQERRREAADDQSSARGAAFGGGSPGAAQEAPTESNAEGERGAEGQSLFGVIVPKGNARHLPFQDGKPANEFGGEFESRGSERASERAGLPNGHSKEREGQRQTVAAPPEPARHSRRVSGPQTCRFPSALA